jgi:DUF4097 and DUF4098 domain-containing protein YvlB
MEDAMKLSALILLIVFSGTFLMAAEHEEKIQKTFPLTSGGTVDLSNVDGLIEVVTHPSQTVEVKAVKKSENANELGQVEVIFDASASGLKIRVENKLKNNHVKTDFFLAVPENLKAATYRSVNGRISAQGGFGEIRMETVNGNIDFDGMFASGQCRTVNGKVAVIVEKPLAGVFSAQSVNGGIRLELNRKSSFLLEGKTVNGSIACEFEVPVQKGFVGSSISGSVNSGQNRVELKTVNGSITVAKI